MSRIYIDTESNGLKGSLLSIQFAVNKGKIFVINNPCDPANSGVIEALRGLLDNPEATFVAYNAGFDYIKLMQMFKKIGYKPNAFKCEWVDLYSKVLSYKPFNELPTGKSPLSWTKIAIEAADIIQPEILKDLNRLTPGLSGAWRCSRREVKKRKDLIDLCFYFDFSMSLKNIAPLFSKAKTQKIEDVFYLPKHVGFREDMRVPYPLEGEKKYYEALEKANQELLSNPETRKKIDEYSRLDIELLRELESFLISHNSEKEILEADYNDRCTAFVANTRFFGVELDAGLVRGEKTQLEKRKKEIERNIGINPASSKQRKVLIESALDPDLGEIEIESTGVPILETLLKDRCFKPEMEKAIEELIEYKPLCQSINQLDTFELGGGRFYPNFKVIGTSTDRMSGRDGFNAQGVGKKSKLRNCVKIKCIGDFDGQETTIYAAWTKDAVLNRELDDGIDLHTMNVKRLFKEFYDQTYEELMALKANGDKAFKGSRGKAKNTWFGILYGSEKLKQSEQIGCSIDEIDGYMSRFFDAYKSLTSTRKNLRDSFCTVARNTDDGYSEKEVRESWTEDAIEKMSSEIVDVLGKRNSIRFWKNIAVFVWKNWKKYGDLVQSHYQESGEKEKTITRDTLRGKEQIVSESVRSSTRGCVIRLQKTLTRQLGNWPIQRTGSVITKSFIAQLWKKFQIQGFNVHDEIVITDMNGHDFDEIKNEINSLIVEWRKEIKHLGMDFHEGKTWADK